MVIFFAARLSLVLLLPLSATLQNSQFFFIICQGETLLKHLEIT